MKIRSKFILPVAAITVLFVLVAFFTISSTIQTLVTEQRDSFIDYAQNNLAGKAKERQKAIYSSIDLFGQKALEQAALFSAIPAVQDAYKLAHTGNINDERDPAAQQAREMLRTALAPHIKGFQQQTGIKEFKLHYHLPNGRSLVRLWRDGWQTKRNGKKVDISDDISSFRRTVVEINQGSHQPLTGIEVGRGGFALRGLSAVTDEDGRHLGSCEVLLSFADLLKANHIGDEFQIAVYMNADLLPIATRLQDPKKNPVIDGKYVFTSSTNPELTNRILTGQMLDAGRSTESARIIENQYVATFPIPDYSGKVAGVMALIYQMDTVTALASRISDNADKTIASTNLRFSLGSLIMLALIITTIYFITRILTTPLQRAVALTKKVAAGDLSNTIEHTSKDEVGDLAEALNHMIDSLKHKASEAQEIAAGNLQIDVTLASPQDTMGRSFKEMVESLNNVMLDILRASEQIDTGSQQVSDSSQTLSEGATESAAAIEEISSSMNIIGNQTQQSAENAGKANRLANEAQQAAQSGSAQMNEMVSAMNEINQSGQNISKIIKVIDEIAFQTNLLALNAAVEAARAGQHGKGFAVVAEEVRNLAARSAKAAEETAQLIKGSVEKANNGTQIAEKTSESLGAIVGAISKVTDLVAEIAAASNEQAQGISQVNQGLVQIDHSVQQNTATAEESAAASEELSTQAAVLRQMIGRFQLAGGSPQNTPPQLKPAPSRQFAPQPAPPQSLGWGESPGQKQNIKLDDNEFGKY